MNLPYEKYKRVLVNDSSGSFVEYVKDYFKQQSLRTGAPLPSIGELNIIAYNVFYANRKKEAIQLLEWAISLYPHDANLYDSMGEIQESAGNTEKAKYYYNQGLSTIKSQKDKLSDNTYTSKIKWFNKRLDEIQKR
jgi:tetratricopeptide (TPR) repeat protein